MVFQPHTYSRTTELFDDFVHALSLADRIVLVPVYAARKEEGYTKTSNDIVEALRARNKEAVHLETLDGAMLTVQESVSGTDVVLVMGAGNISSLANKLTQQ